MIQLPALQSCCEESVSRMMNLDARAAPVRHVSRFTWWAQPSKADVQHWCVQWQHRAAGTEPSGACAISHGAHRAALIHCSHSVTNTGNTVWSFLFLTLSLSGRLLYQSHSAGYKRRWLHLWYLHFLCLWFFIVKSMLGALTIFS